MEAFQPESGWILRRCAIMAIVPPRGPCEAPAAAAAGSRGRGA